MRSSCQQKYHLRHHLESFLEKKSNKYMKSVQEYARNIISEPYI